MDRELIHKIADRIYSLFVVNTAAAGIQQKNGIYSTEYIPVTPHLIESMIMAKGSMGCYQQGYKTGYINSILYCRHIGIRWESCENTVACFFALHGLIKKQVFLFLKGRFVFGNY